MQRVRPGRRPRRPSEPRAPAHLPVRLPWLPRRVSPRRGHQKTDSRAAARKLAYDRAAHTRGGAGHDRHLIAKRACALITGHDEHVLRFAPRLIQPGPRRLRARHGRVCLSQWAPPASSTSISTTIWQAHSPVARSRAGGEAPEGQRVRRAAGTRRGRHRARPEVARATHAPARRSHSTRSGANRRGRPGGRAAEAGRTLSTAASPSRSSRSSRPSPSGSKGSWPYGWPSVTEPATKTEQGAELRPELDRLLARAKSQRQAVEELRLRAAESVVSG